MEEKPGGAKSISDILKFFKPKIKIIPKKEVISLIAYDVKLVKDPLKNWKIVAYKLRSLSAEEASRMYYGIKQGTRVDSTDVKGAFESYVKNIKNPKKPKQVKLF